MMNFTRSKLGRFCGFLAGAVLALLLHRGVIAQPSSLELLQPCIQQIHQTTPISTAFVNASYFEGNQGYHVVVLFPSQPETIVRDALMISDSKTCQTNKIYSSGASVPVTKHVSLDVARALTQTLVEREIAEMGGVEQYQSYLNRAAQKEGKLYLDEHRVWVLRQMGIVLDPRIQIIDPTSIN